MTWQNNIDRSKSTIRGIIVHRKKSGTWRPTRRPRNACILDDEAEEQLIRHVGRDPEQKLSQISDAAGVSASTVERIMKPYACPLPTTAHHSCQEHKRSTRLGCYDRQDWPRITSTDEAAFEIEDNVQRENC